MALKEITKKIPKKYSVPVFAKIVRNGPLEWWRWKKLPKIPKKIFRPNFRQNCPKWSPREMALKEITKKILKKILRSNFRQNCPKWSPRDGDERNYQKKFQNIFTVLPSMRVLDRIWTKASKMFAERNGVMKKISLLWLLLQLSIPQIL